MYLVSIYGKEAYDVLKDYKFEGKTYGQINQALNKTIEVSQTLGGFANYATLYKGLDDRLSSSANGIYPLVGGLFVLVGASGVASLFISLSFLSSSPIYFAGMSVAACVGVGGGIISTTFGGVKTLQYRRFYNHILTAEEGAKERQTMMEALVQRAKRLGDLKDVVVEDINAIGGALDIKSRAEEEGEGSDKEG